MYGLPKDFNGDFFVGRTLEAVMFTENTVHLAFDNDVSVTIESSLQHVTSQAGELSDPQAVPLRHSRLMELTGHRVLNAADAGSGTLRLQFDNDHVVNIFDDTESYESYSISHNGTAIFV